MLDLLASRSRPRASPIPPEVDAATGFTEAFTHLRTEHPALTDGANERYLGEGINPGLRSTADATNTHTFWELIRHWTVQSVEGEAYDQALAMVVEAQAALLHGPVLGHGRQLRSDGQFFVATEQGETHENLVNAKYGNTPPESL